MTAVDQPRTHAHAGAAPAPGRRPSAPHRRPGRHLRPVERPRRGSAPPHTRRSMPGAPVLVGTGMVIVALFTLAAMHALLIGGQLRLDRSERELASETEEIRVLRLRVAELESPGRVLDVARERLGMVEPSEVGYLLPVTVDTGDDAPVRVPAAEPPPPPEPEVVETVSPEQRAVDAAGAADAEPGGDGDDPAADTTPTRATDSEARPDAAPDAPTAQGGDE